MFSSSSSFYSKFLSVLAEGGKKARKTGDSFFGYNGQNIFQINWKTYFDRSFLLISVTPLFFVLAAHYESLQDKLAQLRDAREALDELRKDHMEKKRIEAEEMERQRQIQMAHKLEIMRQKKQVNSISIMRQKKKEKFQACLVMSVLKKFSYIW